MVERKVRLDHLLGVYRVGSGDWPWAEEYDNLIDQTDTRKLLARIREEGIREPVLLGSDGRVWDGHHRIIVAMQLGIDSVPVEFAGDGGALNALIAEKRAEWEAELRQDATVHVEHRAFDTGHYTDPERQVRRIIKTPWLPVPDTTNHESEGKA